jgi:hypothetical protein
VNVLVLFAGGGSGRTAIQVSEAKPAGFLGGRMIPGDEVSSGVREVATRLQWTREEDGYMISICKEKGPDSARDSEQGVVRQDAAAAADDGGEGREFRR